MTALLMTGIRLLLLVCLLVGTPALLVACCAKASWLKCLSNVGLLCVSLPLFVALGLHVTNVPITAAALIVTHLSIFTIVLIIALFIRNRKWSPLPSCFSDCPPLPIYSLQLILPLALLLLLLIPWTHFTGVDTYKWQDLATSVRMEESLPWVVHPISLLGFTPRAYPPAHPVLLATVQMVGDFGVDGGFAVVSFLIAFVGVVSATRLAACLFSPRLAYAVGLLYVFSPVFMRYTHWATGRGLFLAIFPAFIALLIETQTTGTLARTRRALSVLLVGVLLLLTHKVALVAVPLLLAATLIGCVPAHCRQSVLVRLLLALPFGLLGVAIASPALLPGLAGVPIGVLRTGIIRFGWMLPVAAVGVLMMPAGQAERPGYGGWFLFLAMLPALTLAFERQMYGALYALPFVCLFAVVGFRALLGGLPRSCHRWLVGVAAALVVCGAVMTVVHRSARACSKPLYRAAMFLEAQDPEGPFMVHAPGIARTRILAYVSGCARFDVRVDDSARPQMSALTPLWHGNVRASVDAWATALRGLVTLDDTAVDWYGDPRTHYHFIIDGEGDIPSGAERIYSREGIAIFQRNALP